MAEVHYLLGSAVQRRPEAINGGGNNNAAMVAGGDGSAVVGGAPAPADNDNNNGDNNNNDNNNNPQRRRQQQQQQQQQQEAADRGRAVQNLLWSTSPLLRSLKLTTEELQWAKRVKTSVEAEEPELLDSLSDWMIAQIAIVAKGGVEEAMERAQSYKGFIEEYETIKSVTLGVQCVREFLDSRPSGDFMYLSNSPLESPICVSDWSKVQGFASRTRLRGYFYILEAMHYDLYHIREGAIHLIDCKGFDWTSNFGYSEYLRWWSELGGWYPLRTKKVRVFHSPTVANVIFSMGRKLLPAGDRDKMKIGCVSPSGSLRNVYQQPNSEVARERILSRVRDGLEKRYSMEEKFRIDDFQQN